MDVETEMIALLCREIRQAVLAHRQDHPMPMLDCPWCKDGAVAHALSDINDMYGVAITKAVQQLYDRAYPIDYTGIM